MECDGKNLDKIGNVNVQDHLTFETRYGVFDSEWEAFVETAPVGVHTQSCYWSAFKAAFSWSPIRIVVKRDGRIVAGAQVLERRLPFGLTIARLHHGPVLASYDPELSNTVIQYLFKAIRVHKINYLALQPDVNSGSVDGFSELGFQVSSFMDSQRATIFVDLSQRTETLLQRMRRTTRNNIRLACDRGIQIREGTDNDIATLHRLLKATGRRRSFDTRSYAYYTTMWQHLEPAQHIKLFVAEYEGEPISVLLTVPFGNTVTAEILGWSGAKARMRPNELLIWRAMEWSKDNGYLKFDLGGIEVSAAHALLTGNSLPEAVKSSPTRFKLGFGGSVVLLPPTFEYISNRALRSLLRRSLSILGRRNLKVLVCKLLSVDHVRSGGGR